MLANGQNKARMSKDLTARRIAVWRLLFLSSGEVTLTQHIQSAGGKTRGGQQVRCVDVPADAGKGLGLFDTIHEIELPELFADTLVKASGTYYGAACRMFVEGLTKYRSNAEKILRKQIKSFVDEQTAKHGLRGASGEVIRVLNRFAFVAAAGELGLIMRILPWTEGEAYTGAATCFGLG
jgi:putative DNA primase/helicase